MFPHYRVKPSKGSSVLGMIVGVVFIFIGITQAVHIGLFGIIWTLIALAITVFHAVNVFSNKGVSTYQVDVEDHRINSTSNENFESKMRQLHRLREDKIINEEEYQRKKDELLNKKW